MTRLNSLFKNTTEISISVFKSNHFEEETFMLLIFLIPTSVALVMTNQGTGIVKHTAYYFIHKSDLFFYVVRMNFVRLLNKITLYM